MKIEFQRDETAQDVHVIVRAREKSPEVEALLERLCARNALPAWDERGEERLFPNEIMRIYTENRRVCAETTRGTFALRMRLYELETQLDGSEFVRISNSEIVNRREIRRLDFSLAGTIRLTLRSGTTTYVSRRYVRRIREIFGR